MKRLFLVISLATIAASTSWAFEFNRVPAGLIKGARQSWVSDTTIKLDVGYGEIMGSYWEISPTDTLVTTGYTLSGLGTTTNGIFHYLYIDRVNSSLPNVAIKNSTTAPTWSADFMGWYNGSDRCIGAVWVKSDGKVQYFYCSDDTTYKWQTTIALTPGSVSTTNYTWNLYDFSSYSPVNLEEMEMAVAIWQSSVTWTVCAAGIMPEMGASKYADGITATTVYTWAPFARNMARKCKWMAYASSSTGNIVLALRSYKIER